MRPLDARGLRVGVLLHAAVVLGATSSLGRDAGVYDGVGMLLVAAACIGYVTARAVTTGRDAAHTAFVAGAIGGLIAAAMFVTGVRADSASGIFWRIHYGLATAGLPEWLVAGYGDAVVLVVGLLLGTLYALAALTGGAIAVGDLLQVDTR